ncbi:MAG: hypothetical protein ACRD1K_20490 [Acidimicrobiales bacterium]
MSKFSVKPFKFSAIKKSKKLVKAADLLLQAAALIEEAQPFAENWADYETMAHFAGEVRSLLESDHGEAGFLPWVNLQVLDPIQRRTYPVTRSDGRVVNVSVPTD